MINYKLHYLKGIFERIKMTDTIDTIVNDMYAYQKKNDIKGKCLTNCQTLLDISRSLGVNEMKSCACICVAYCGAEKLIFKKHIILLLSNGAVYDPSYEVYSLENKMYYHTYVSYNQVENPPFEKDDISGFIEFIGISNQMNNGDFKLLQGKELDYYNNQFNYIMDHYIERNNDIAIATLGVQVEVDTSEVLWCEHEMCLESTESFATERELEEHISKCH